MIAAADFDALLCALRAAGLRIGVTETLRASYLLEHMQDSSASLQFALRALLVKSETELEPFAAVFAEWAQDLAACEARLRDASITVAAFSDGSGLGSVGIGFSASAPAVSLRSRSHGLPKVRPKRFPLARWLTLGILILSGMAAVGITLRAFLNPRAPVSAGPVALETPPSPLDAGLAHPAEPPPVVATTEAPRVELQASFPPQPLVKGALLFVLFLPLGLVLFFALRRRRYLPSPAPLPTVPGPARCFVDLPRPQAGFPVRFLDRAAQEALVYGIGQFTSALSTRRLDVSRSVRATAAAAGAPMLHFLRARHSREVFLWLDESVSATDPSAWAHLSRLCNEAEQTLQRGGLPVERALFWGVPEHLHLVDVRTGASAPITPADLDERRQGALVVILTDGKILHSRLADELHRPEVRACLRTLSYWPRLAFVDGSPAPVLRSVLDPFELAVILPAELPTFLGGESRFAREPIHATTRPGAIHDWAAAVALAPEPVSEETAFFLRDRLSLAAGAETLVLLRRISGSTGGLLRFSRRERSRCLTRLLDRETIPAGLLATLPARLEKSLLGRTLAFFRDQIAHEITRRESADHKAPFLDTAGEHHLYMQRSLLDLWDRPDAAARSLYQLHQSDLKEEITSRLADYVPSECGASDEQIQLPWSLASLNSVSQQLLLEMGFGGDSLTFLVTPTPRPGRLTLAWGGCIGLVLAGMVGAGVGIGERIKSAPTPTPAASAEPTPAPAPTDMTDKQEVEDLGGVSISEEARRALRDFVRNMDLGVTIKDLGVGTDAAATVAVPSPADKPVNRQECANFKTVIELSHLGLLRTIDAKPMHMEEVLSRACRATIDRILAAANACESEKEISKGFLLIETTRGEFIKGVTRFVGAGCVPITALGNASGFALPDAGSAEATLLAKEQECYEKSASCLWGDMLCLMSYRNCIRDL